MRARVLWASTAIAAIVIAGGAVPASAAPVDLAAVTQQRILDRVRAAAAPVATSEPSDDAAPSAEATITPGQLAILDAADAGVRAEFSGHDIDESLSVRASPLGDAASVSAASEAGLCAVGAAMVAGAIGGAAGGAMHYALSSGEKTSADAWAAVGSGAIGGAIGGGLGSSVVWAGEAVQSANRAATLAPAVIPVGEVKSPAVPAESVGRSTRNGKGTVYDIPVGTPEISDRVAAIRIMDPVHDRKYDYPNGYATYMNKHDQAIDPLSGESLARTDPLWHIPLK